LKIVKFFVIPRRTLCRRRRLNPAVNAHAAGSASTTSRIGDGDERDAIGG
jgi:hypothetical protein